MPVKINSLKTANIWCSQKGCPVFLYSKKISLGHIVRQSIRSAAITVIGLLLGGVITFLSIYYFPTVEYGYTQNLMRVGQMLSFVGFFGMNYTMVIYLQQYAERVAQRAAFLSYSIVLSLIWTSLLMFVLWFFKEPIIALYSSPEDKYMLSKFYYTLPCYTLLSVVMLWIEFYLIGIHHASFQAMAREVLLRLTHILLIILYSLEIISFDSFIALFTLSFLTPIFFLFVKAYQKEPIRLDAIRKYLSRQELKNIFSFSAYHMFILFVTMSLLIVDSVMLGMLTHEGFRNVAILSLAIFAVSVIRGIVRSINNASMPEIAKNFAQNDLTALKQNFTRANINIQLIVVLLVALIVINQHHVDWLVSLINQEYQNISSIILLLLVGHGMDLMTGLSMEVISSSKHYRYNLWVSFLTLILMLVAGWLLIPIYATKGAAITASIGFGFYGLAKSMVLYTKLQLRTFEKKTFFVLLLALILCLLIVFLPSFGHPLIDLLANSLIFTALYIFFVYRFSLSDDARRLINQFFKFRQKNAQ